jgi:4,5-dihydroxyphthalate decarboxylase
MVRTQKYDVCEMAIGAFLQAHEAGKPLFLLPVVMVGGFHYKSVYVAPDVPVEPADLRGKRIGVRSYSQTTGLWARGWLAADYGVTPDSVTWVTTEGSHSDAYEDPANVVRTENSLPGDLRGGQISAAILGTGAPADLVPVIADWAERSRAWHAKHGTVPINHMVTVTRDTPTCWTPCISPSPTASPRPLPGPRIRGRCRPRSGAASATCARRFAWPPATRWSRA